MAKVIGAKELLALCRQRGFVFPSAEIYGGMSSSFGNSFDYGPLGVALKQNIKRLWEHHFIKSRPECVLLDSGLISFLAAHARIRAYCCYCY